MLDENYIYDEVKRLVENVYIKDQRYEHGEEQEHIELEWQQKKEFVVDLINLIAPDINILREVLSYDDDVILCWIPRDSPSYWYSWQDCDGNQIIIRDIWEYNAFLYALAEYELNGG